MAAYMGSSSKLGKVRGVVMTALPNLSLLHLVKEYISTCAVGCAVIVVFFVILFVYGVLYFRLVCIEILFE